MTLVPVDPSNALAVSDYLDKARQWLATAVEMTGPAEIAAAKAEIATAAEATKQLNLSKEIQLDAKEMVRRAEYALGRSIRQGQADGLILGRGQITERYDRHSGDRSVTANSTKARPSDFASISELSGSQNTPGIYQMADSATPEEFEAALQAAKAEENLSRINVVRKIKGEVEQTAHMTRQQKADVIADLAERGYSSHQIADSVGVSAQRVREIARSFDIDIPADKAVGRQVRIDHTAAVESAVTSLDHWASSLSFIDFAEVDGSEADEWVASLNHSLTELRRFIKQIKETTHV